MSVKPQELKALENIPLVGSQFLTADHGGTGSSPENGRKGDYDDRAHEPDHPLHRRAITHILFFETFISIAFLGVREAIVLYCINVLFYVDGGAPKMIDVYAAVVPCLPVFGGILADVLAGSFRMIKIGAFTTLAGVLLLTLDVVPFENWYARTISIQAKRGVFLVGFTAMFLGYGCYGANVGPFAARQVEQAGEKAVRTLFHWFYWSTTFGLAVSLPIADYVERAFNFGVGFGVLSALLIIGIIVLMSLRHDYVEIPPQRDALTNVVRIIFQSLKNRFSSKEVTDDKQKPKGTLDHSKQEFGGSFSRLKVDEVKHLLKTLPAFHTVTIYAVVYFFIIETYLEQYKRLNPYFGEIGNSGMMPNVFYPVYGSVVVLVLTPVLCYTYPWLQRKGFKITPLRRIGVGIFFSVLSVVSASLVEFRRKDVMSLDGGTFNLTDTVTGDVYRASTLHCGSQLPQFTFSGVAEAFIRVAGLEFAYLEGPDNLKGLSTGLYILMSGVGSYILARILVLIVNALSTASPWYVSEINDGHMEYFYLILAGVLLFDMLYLYLISRNYDYAHWRERAAQEGGYPGNEAVTPGYSRVAETSSGSDADASPTRNIEGAPK
ncbi:solute carrier family 15 member 4-like [Asterias rubens]|uniref:solute carrier family 15 member 4-like n=1 Tax=Asterias rubens TaxID=7604 RepID=UPI0014557351|nr:solute carrier family 15 member 4-like [Asterias rubens]XP_033644421.1 solute carrier family 15 member 4-like [Asterias rubens]XP_033644422.1 solute carrier family 15 member 4-like [Asterias rubens]XP_033644423.1 solute carrier family 15 member 4-like [Asterias rubens]XP_033644424.1 solute carrier family 15 member 4-like [Asterias rubens]